MLTGFKPDDWAVDRLVGSSILSSSRHFYFFNFYFLNDFFDFKAQLASKF